MAIFEGAGVALVTPMNENLEVNYDKLEELLEEQIAGGTDAIVICGTTGESATLTEEELQTFCMALPRYKRPRKIIFADVPRNPTGKIEKPKLREKYGATHLVAAQNQG